MIRLAIPVLHVGHATAAEAFYCGRLGFERAYAYRPFEGQDDPCYMGLTRDGVWLHLSSFPGDGVPGGVVNLYVDDVDALHAELLAKGVTPAMEPTDQTWGTREVYVKDADGNSLRFVQERAGAGEAAATRLSRHINAPRERVYRALLDASAVATWMVPDGMTSHVHAFDAREGGRFRITLSYDAPAGIGKTSADADTYHGRFARLVPNELVVEVMAFETDDAAMRGEMTVTFTLADRAGGTEVCAVHEHLPPGLSPADNATGWRMSLDKLARLVEAGPHAENPLHPPPEGL